MDFHEIDTKGKIWIERVTSFPAWSSADIGRVLYNTVTGQFAYCGVSAWRYSGDVYGPASTTTNKLPQWDTTTRMLKDGLTPDIDGTLSANSDSNVPTQKAVKTYVDGLFATGGVRKLWFYENSAPTGWTIVTASDALLAVKGGTTYTTGGAQVGTWTQPDCILDATMIPAHTHGAAGSHGHTLSWYGPTSGDGVGSESASKFTIGSNLYNNDGYIWQQGNASYYRADTTGDHTHTSVGGGLKHFHGSAYRPLAQVGIICSRN